MGNDFTDEEKKEPAKRVSIPQVKRKPAAKLDSEADIAQSLPPPEPPPMEEIPAGEMAGEPVPVLENPDLGAAPAAKPKRGESAPALEELCANAVPFAEWPEVLQLLKEYSRPVSAAFQGSAAYCSGNYMLIDAKNSMAFELLRKEEQRQKMRDTIRQVTGRDYKLGPYKRPGEPSEFKEDPLELLAKQAEAAGIPVIKK